MNAYKKILLLLLCLTPALANAQHKQLDSLNNALKLAKTDSAKFVALSGLANYYGENDRLKTIYYVDQALPIAKKNNKLLDEATLFEFKGYEIYHLGKYADAFEYLQRSIEILEDPKNESNSWIQEKNQTPHKFRLFSLALTHLVMGHLQGKTNNTAGQVAEYKMTIKIATETGDNTSLGLACMSLGDVYVDMNKTDSALILEKIAERSFKQAGYLTYLGSVYDIMGDITLKKGNNAEALQLYHKALNTSISTHTFTHEQVVYDKLARYFLSLQQKDSSLYYARRNLTAAKILKSKNIGNAYETLYKTYQLNGLTDSAYKYQGLALVARDSSSKTDLKSLADFQRLSMQTQLSLQKLQKEKEEAQSRIRTYALTAIIVIILIIAVFIYRNSRQRKKANYLLYKQKEEIAAQRDALESKNHELEIESALERVRSIAMGMQQPDDMLDICRGISDELEALGVNNIRNVQTAIIYESRGIYMNYEYYSLHNKTFITAADYTHPIQAKFVKAMLVEGAYQKVILEKAELAKWFEYQKTTNQFIDPHLAKADSLNYHWFSIGPVALGISLYAHISEEGIALFRRFLDVFRLAYRRYRDVELALEQAREAKIEAALERVRAKTMAMHNSQDVAETAVVMVDELKKLGIETIRCGIGIMHEPGDMEVWTVKTDENDTADMIVGWLDMHMHPLLEGAFTSWRNNIEAYSYELKDEDLFNYYNAINNYPGYPIRYDTSALPKLIHHNEFHFAEGTLFSFSLQQLSDEQRIIFKRFAGVFGLTYRRYLDLKKAEALAVQAQQDLILLKTEKKRAEDALSELKSTQTQLIQREKMASLGELTAGIAHEIQNPLNFVNNFSEVSIELLQELKDEEEAGNKEDVIAIVNDLTQNLQKINHHGKRADFIVKGMLQHSRTNTGEKQLTDINILADEFLKLSYHGLRAKDKSFNAELITNFDEQLPKINIAQQDIGRVLLNLFNNAFYAVNQKQKTAGVEYKPEVTVSTSAEKNNLIISVKDNGNGIPENIKEKIMQPFFTTKPTGEGTGLGLSLSYDIVVKGHGGTILVDTKEDAGSEFTIYLPIS